MEKVLPGSWQPLGNGSQRFCSLCHQLINEKHVDIEAHLQVCVGWRSGHGAFFHAEGDSEIPPPLWPWVRMDDDGCSHCLACNKVVDEKHVHSLQHIRRVNSWRLEQTQNTSEPPEEFKALVPWDEADPESERYLKCLLCSKWVMDDSHAESGGSAEHMRRMKWFLHSEEYRSEIRLLKCRFTAPACLIKSMGAASTALPSDSGAPSAPQDCPVVASDCSLSEYSRLETPELAHGSKKPSGSSSGPRAYDAADVVHTALNSESLHSVSWACFGIQEALYLTVDGGQKLLAVVSRLCTGSEHEGVLPEHANFLAELGIAPNEVELLLEEGNHVWNAYAATSLGKGSGLHGMVGCIRRLGVRAAGLGPRRKASIRALHVSIGVAVALEHGQQVRTPGFQALVDAVRALGDEPRRPGESKGPSLETCAGTASPDGASSSALAWLNGHAISETGESITLAASDADTSAPEHSDVSMPFAVARCKLVVSLKGHVACYTDGVLLLIPVDIYTPDFSISILDHPPAHLAGACSAGRWVHLEPEDCVFKKPVWLFDLHVHCGADTFFRTTSANTLERLENAIFRHGIGVVGLDHFCNVIPAGPFVTAPVACHCWWHPRRRSVRVIISHASESVCPGCYPGFHQLAGQLQSQGFMPAWDGVPERLSCTHGEDVRISTGDGEGETIFEKVMFGPDFPQLSSGLLVTNPNNVFTISITSPSGSTRRVLVDTSRVEPLPLPQQSTQLVVSQAEGGKMRLTIRCDGSAFKDRSANKGLWQTLGGFFRARVDLTRFDVEDGSRYFEAVIVCSVHSAAVSFSAPSGTDEAEKVLQHLRDVVHAEFGGGEGSHKASGHGRGLGHLSLKEVRLFEALRASTSP